MTTTGFQDLVILLQTAVSPVILISGVGLLLLTMTNRLGRLIDRQRLLCTHLRTCTPHESDLCTRELKILWQRARIIRCAIILASVCALCAALIVILLFLIPLFSLALGFFVKLLFVFCLVSLVASLLVFIVDVNQSLAALELELEEAKVVPSQLHRNTVSGQE